MKKMREMKKEQRKEDVMCMKCPYRRSCPTKNPLACPLHPAARSALGSIFGM